MASPAKLEEDGEAPPRVKILFCGLEFPCAAQLTREVFRDSPIIDVVEVDRLLVSEHMKDATIVVPKMCRITREMIESAHRLQLINQFGVGLEGVDIAACDDCGVHVSNIPSDGTGNAASVAELAVYMIIGLLRRHHELQASMQRRILGAPMGRTLMGCSVLMVGYGNIGRELARRLKPFDVRLTAVRQGAWGSDKTSEEHRADEALVDAKGSSDNTLSMAGEADVIVVMCSQTPQTIGMINAEFINAMKPGALIVNVARGRLLDKEAILQGLQSGQIGGLAADVQWTEPFDPSDPIAKHPGVIFTPHVGGVTEISVSRMAKTLAKNVESILDGRAPLIRRNSRSFGLRYSLSGVLSRQSSLRSHGT